MTQDEDEARKRQLIAAGLMELVRYKVAWARLVPQDAIEKDIAFILRMLRDMGRDIRRQDIEHSIDADPPAFSGPLAAEAMH